MKKLHTILVALLMTATTFAQAPEKMSYQAVIRDSGDALVANQAVGMRISILQTTANGTAVYVETQTPTTNINGLVSIEIGNGTPVTGTFAGIDWATGPYFIKTETDPTGSTTYTITGTTQLMSVPYALYAKYSGNSTPTTPNLESVLSENNSANNQQIKDLQDPTEAQDAVTLSVLLEKISALQYQIYVLQGSGTVTDQDGNSYIYLTYGDQVWTVENAEMVTYRDGTPIPQVTDGTEWTNLTTGAWSYYNNDPTKPRFYNWYAVMGIHDTDPNTPNKEFAPEGWHVPSDAEWTTLEEHLIANGYNYDESTTQNKIAKAMVSTTGWDSSTDTGAPGNDQSLNNGSGFNAFPEGDRTSLGSFLNEGILAIFWSSTENDANSSWYRNLSTNYSLLFGNYNNKKSGFSVRFVRD